MTRWRVWSLAVWLVLMALQSAFAQPPGANPTSSAPAGTAAATPTAQIEGKPTGVPEEEAAAEGGHAAEAQPKRGADKCIRAALRAMAFLLAFLTVVGVWKIPPSQTRLTSGQGTAAAPGNGGAKSNSAKAQEDASPFASNFGRTVIAGLGGVAGIAIFKDVFKFDGEPGFNPSTFYIFWFVVFFFLILFLSSLARAWAESLRSSIAAGEEPVWPRPGGAGEPPGSGAPPGHEHPRGTAAKSEQRASEFTKLEEERTKRNRRRRWRRSRLVFFDTLFNVIQGNNQLQTAALGDTILDLQRSLQGAADRARNNIQRAVRRALEAEKRHRREDLEERGLAKLKDLDIDDQSVRVSISILSPDGTGLSYIARGPGSLVRYFDRRSIAWVAVCSGRALWWKRSYEPHLREIVLLEKESKVLPEEPKPLLLADYFQERESRDYDAFLVLPVPWFRRGLGSHYRLAGVHIAFRRELFLDALVSGTLEPRKANHRGEKEAQPYYDRWRTLLESPPEKVEESIGIKDDTLRTVLLQAIDMLGELLCYYNEEVLALGNRPASGAR